MNIVDNDVVIGHINIDILEQYNEFMGSDYNTRQAILEEDKCIGYIK